MVENEAGIILRCERKIAYDSPDHIIPEGTRKDNSTNYLFNRKIYRLFGEGKKLKILDLGCSGGGFVRECIDDGHFAIGLEGSDYSKKIKRAEWGTIPENLFTCDITKNFDLYQKNKNRILFNLITSWEVLEHLQEEAIFKLAQNVRKHLASDGIWIVSIAEYPCVIDGTNLHQTVKPSAWWEHKFQKLGFVILKDYKKYFNNQFVRGPYQDNTKSFNLVLTLPKNKLPPIPKEKLKRIIFEKLIGNRMYITIKKLILRLLPNENPRS